MENDAASLEPPIWDELPDYEPRHIRFRELVALDGWTLKLYGVSVRKESISEGLREAWIEDVLGPGGTHAMEVYLSRQLNDDV